MGTIKQIVYRLEDYRLDNPYYTTPGYEDNFYNRNLIPENEIVTHLGIQAPAGTVFYINGNDNRFVMGRTGVYEVDENINILSLIFEQPIDYDLDTESTAAAAQEAQELIQRADDWRASKMNYLAKEDYIKMSNYGYEIKSGKEAEFLTYYNSLMYGGTWADGTTISIEDSYTSQMDKANLAYIKAVNGIYKEKGKKELENVIIDFMIGSDK